MPKATADMLVITKFYDLVIWSCNHVAKFPRSHRFRRKYQMTRCQMRTTEYRCLFSVLSRNHIGCRAVRSDLAWGRLADHARC